MSKTQINKLGGNFGADYISTSFIQQEINEYIVKQFAFKIKDNFTSGKYTSTALTIVDLGCGYGEATNSLLTWLKSLNVPINKIIGYDISEELINKATQNYANLSELSFIVQNIETINDVKKFDVAVAFFSLQWINDIACTAKLIADSLKPGGSLMFMFLLDKPEFFEAREEFLSLNFVKYRFKEGFWIKPTVFKPNEYIKAFEKYIDPNTLITMQFIDDRDFSYNGMIQFLSSWMPEIRHLKYNSSNNEVGSQYMSNYVTDFLKYVLSKGMIQKLQYCSENKELNIKLDIFCYFGDRVDYHDDINSNNEISITGVYNDGAT